VLGSVVGVGVDSRDHVYIIHRQAPLNERTEIGAATDPPTGECCIPAPYVLEFDPDGNLMNAWGGEGEGYTWPASNHGISIDPMDNVWIGGNGGATGTCSSSRVTARSSPSSASRGASSTRTPPSTLRPAGEDLVRRRSQEAYVADGYRNRRVAVVDMNTGEIKRFWGAYGNVPERRRYGPVQPRRPAHRPVPHAGPLRRAHADGLVYVCDRPNNRIQVFQKDGTFVDEVQIAPRTLGDGAIWDISFSRDPGQTYMYVADGKNMKVYIMDRLSLEVLTSFGDGGRQPGLFFAVHSIVTDSQGNIYTTETYEGKRVQKFLYRGNRSDPGAGPGRPVAQGPATGLSPTVGARGSLTRGPPARSLMSPVRHQATRSVRTGVPACYV
jgi:hypothetical protein